MLIIGTNQQYVPIFWYLLFSLILSGFIFGLSVLITYHQLDFEKITAYECGFMPFSDSRQHFDVQFYLVAILFIVFDLEVAFLFPWAVSIHLINVVGFWFMIIFVTILTIGFVYEWRRGALDWS